MIGKRLIERRDPDRLVTGSIRSHLDAWCEAWLRHAIQGRKTPLQVLEEQLDLLEGQMAEVADAVHRRDSDRLLAQSIFLEDRFNRPQSGLSLPPEQ